MEYTLKTNKTASFGFKVASSSHSIYDDPRLSGFVKLSSGRTLSDFFLAKSRWQVSVLDAMKESCKKQDMLESGKFGSFFSR